MNLKTNASKLKSAFLPQFELSDDVVEDPNQLVDKLEKSKKKVQIKKESEKVHNKEMEKKANVETQTNKDYNNQRGDRRNVRGGNRGQSNRGGPRKYRPREDRQPEEERNDDNTISKKDESYLETEDTRNNHFRDQKRGRGGNNRGVATRKFGPENHRINDRKSGMVKSSVKAPSAVHGRDENEWEEEVADEIFNQFENQISEEEDNFDDNEIKSKSINKKKVLKAEDGSNFHNNNKDGNQSSRGNYDNRFWDKEFGEEVRTKGNYVSRNRNPENGDEDRSNRGSYNTNRYRNQRGRNEGRPQRENYNNNHRESGEEGRPRGNYVNRYRNTENGDEERSLRTNYNNRNRTQDEGEEGTPSRGNYNNRNRNVENDEEGRPRGNNRYRSRDGFEGRPSRGNNRYVSRGDGERRTSRGNGNPRYGDNFVGSKKSFEPTEEPVQKDFEFTVGDFPVLE